MSAMVCLYNLYSCAFPFCFCSPTLLHCLSGLLTATFTIPYIWGCILSLVGSDLYVILVYFLYFYLRTVTEISYWVVHITTVVCFRHFFQALDSFAWLLWGCLVEEVAVGQLGLNVSMEVNVSSKVGRAIQSWTYIIPFVRVTYSWDSSAAGHTSMFMVPVGRPLHRRFVAYPLASWNLSPVYKSPVD